MKNRPMNQPRKMKNSSMASRNDPLSSNMAVAFRLEIDVLVSL
jgi:hypothetical protein